MRNRARVFWLFVLLTIPFAGRADEWKKYKNTDGNLSILFPSEPQESVTQGKDNLQAHTLMAAEKPGFYMVVYTNMANEQRVDNENFELFKNAMFRELPKCQADAEKPASPALNGYIGRGYRLSCEMPNTRLSIASNVYWGKHHAYAVLAMFPADVAEPAGVKQFIESFSLIDPGK